MLKGGDWEEHKRYFRINAKATEWAFDRMKEAFEEVAKDEARNLSTVQEIMIRNCQDQLSFPAMQVTSSLVSIWFHFPASYDEYIALVKVGNVAGEHVKKAISVVQPQLSAAQQNPTTEQENRVGALVTHHPAWMSHHTGGSRRGHPRYTGAQ